jgi:hypothetical protein
MSKDPDYVGLFLTFWPWGLGLAMGAFFAIRRWWKRRGAETWPQTTATVESAGPREVGLPNHGTLIAEIAYSYSVGGEYYAGFIQQESGSQDAAERFAAGFPTGRKLLIRYRADRPDVSVFLPQDQVHFMQPVSAVSAR